jgi:hypothetical protein
VLIGVHLWRDVFLRLGGWEELMAAMIGRGKGWLVWALGFACALVFGRVVLAGEAAKKYGVPARPPVEEPATKPPAAATLEESADWKAVTAAWDFCMPLAASGKSTEAQRQEVDAKLNAAGEAVERLVKAGLLAAAEAGLLTSEIAKIKADVYRNPPTDCTVRCYRVAYIPPAQRSFERLSQRLPLVEALVKAGKVNPAAVGKVLASIEDDLAILADEKKLAEIRDEAKRREAGEKRDAVRAQLDKLKEFLPK